MSELDDIRKRTEGNTPGPWIIEGHAGTGALYSGRDDLHYGYNLCSLSFWDMNGVANSRLIAAAPDLLRIATELEAELVKACEELRISRVAWERESRRLRAALQEDTSNGIS